MTPLIAWKLRYSGALASRLRRDVKAETDHARRRILLRQLDAAQKLEDAVRLEIEAAASEWTASDGDQT